VAVTQLAVETISQVAVEEQVNTKQALLILSHPVLLTQLQ
jgi:hypothetical protein